MKVVLALDSFKGTLSSREVEDILAESLEKQGIESVKIPVADGGEGLIAGLYPILGGEIIKTEVTDPNGDRVIAEYLLKGDLAVVETAQAAGLPMSKKTAADATTYGVGEMISDAEKRGATTFVLGLGGSATNDFGCGFASALGVEFYDEKGERFIPTGRTLSSIKDLKLAKKRKIIALCDVKNPLYGKSGAAYVFAPQKGANDEEVKMLDEGLRYLNDLLIKKGLGDFNVSGGGAAGGLGAAVLAFADGELKSGIDAVLDLVGFDEALDGADYVITGEGRLDSQSFGGKVIDGIMKRAGDIPVIAVVGLSLIKGEDYGLKKVFETNPLHRPFDEVKGRAREDMIICAEKVAAYIKR